MNTMQLAWDNAKVAYKWHGKGKPSEYIGGALSLAHSGVSLRRELYKRLAVASLAVFSVSFALGSLLAVSL